MATMTGRPGFEFLSYDFDVSTDLKAIAEDAHMLTRLHELAVLGSQHAEGQLIYDDALMAYLATTLERYASRIADLAHERCRTGKGVA